MLWTDSAWLHAGLLVAISCLWSVLGGGADATSVPVRRPRPTLFFDADTSLFQNFAHVEPQPDQWSTEDVWAVGMKDESTLPESAGSLPAKAYESPAYESPLHLNLTLIETVSFANSNSMAVGVVVVFVGVLLVFVSCLFACKVQQSSVDQQPDKPKDKKRMTKSVTLRSNASIRSERSTYSTSSHKRAGKILSDRVRGKRMTSDASSSQAMISSTSSDARTVAQDSTVGRTKSSCVQNVSSQSMARVRSFGTLSLGGMSASTEGSFGLGPSPRTSHVPSECRFMVSLDVLTEAAEQGTFSITDAASGLWLRVAIENKTTARRLRVFLGKDSPNPCTTVTPMSDGGSAGIKMEILGADGGHFGMLTLQQHGSFLVTAADQQPLLTIEGNEDNLDLRISACDGRIVATVSCASASPSKEVDNLDFRVRPGTDPVLVVTCILLPWPLPLRTASICSNDRPCVSGNEVYIHNHPITAIAAKPKNT